MKKLAQKHSPAAYDFLIRFYLHTSNQDLKEDKDADGEYRSDNEDNNFQYQTEEGAPIEVDISDMSRPETPTVAKTKRQNQRLPLQRLKIETDFFNVQELQKKNF